VLEEVPRALVILEEVAVGLVGARGRLSFVGARWHVTQRGSIMEGVSRGSSARLVLLVRCTWTRQSPTVG
jgi:hypothetical protein